jgi:hypothetical protein
MKKSENTKHLRRRALEVRETMLRETAAAGVNSFDNPSSTPESQNVSGFALAGDSGV